ncbi:MAG: hypothetical protein H6713_27790 [Myxococcales bacterium]|nr:hypothetical protein [Myxococcales bacterium]MCB9753762.1 hypothetical protein [Myxococcales bacterium]
MSALPARFPKIPSYRGAADPLQCVQRVVATEKLDGTNARLGVPADATRPDQLLVGGRNKMSFEAGFSQPELTRLLEDAGLQARLLALPQLTQARDVALYGEVCGGRIQGGAMYGRQPHLVLFAATVGGAWVGYSRVVQPPPDTPALPTLEQLGAHLRLPLAPRLYEGPPDPAALAELVDQPSAYSQARGVELRGADITHEGVVIWSDPALRDPWGAPLVAKLKHPRRREYSPGRVEAGPEDFAARAVTGERLRHARQHLEADGRWTGDREAKTTALIKRVLRDISKEVHEYAEQLRVHGKRDVRAAIKTRARTLAPAVLD